MRSFSWYLVLVCMVAAVPAGAQSALPDLSSRVPAAAPAPPAPGPRIRVSARLELPAQTERNAVFGRGPKTYKAQFIGLFVSATDDTVTMRNAEMNGALVAVPTLPVTKLEISRGESSNGGHGALVGLAIGALAGLGAAALVLADAQPIDGPGGEVILVGPIVGGVIGVVIGAAIGSSHSSEHWREVSLEELRSPAGH